MTIDLSWNSEGPPATVQLPGAPTTLPFVTALTQVVEQRHQVYVQGANFGAQVVAASLSDTTGTPWLLDGFQIDGLGAAFRATVPAGTPVGTYRLHTAPADLAVPVYLAVTAYSGYEGTFLDRLPPGTVLPQPSASTLGPVPPSLLEYVRGEMNDQAETFLDVVQGSGMPANESRIVLTVNPVQSSTLQVNRLRGGTRTPLVAGVDYVLLDREGVLLLQQALGDLDTLVVSGFSFQFFTDDEYTTFLTTAAQYQNYGRTKVVRTYDHTSGQLVTTEEPYTFANIADVERPALAIAAKVEALERLLTEAAYDISVNSDGAMIDRPERYRQLQQQVAYERIRLGQLNAALNLGLGASEVRQLRRVSYSTGRLVPIIQEREVGDTNFPRQAFPVIGTGAAPGTEVIVAPTPNSTVFGGP